MMRLMEELFHIQERDISITSQSTLACGHYGFLVFKQPESDLGKFVVETTHALDILFKVGIRIRSPASAEQVLPLFDNCWSRRNCATLQRGRI